MEEEKVACYAPPQLALKGLLQGGFTMKNLMIKESANAHIPKYGQFPRD